MQYLLLIYPEDVPFDARPEDERNSIFAQYAAISDAPGVIGGAQLTPVDMTTTVRVEGGSTLTTDGPFVETKEAMGGYYLVEADDIDAAIAVAAKIPAARLGGAIEIRPLVAR